MILKELDPFAPNDKFGAAGRKAEEQLAFYLKRGFGRDEEIHVFNGIRLEHDNDVAQIDHLVMHPYGFVVIESKSVSDSIEIDANGHWSRWFGRRPQGMQSPITQTRLQAQFLRIVLTDRHGEIFTERRGLLAQSIESLAFDIVVAISDNGRIKHQGTLDPAIIKADEVIDKVRALVDSHRPRLRLARVVKELSLYELDCLADFLIVNHRPAGAARAAKAPAAAAVASSKPPLPEPPVDELGRREPSLSVPKARSGKAHGKAAEAAPVAAAPPPPPPPPPTARPAGAAPTAACCGKCGSPDVEIRYGRYGYYFKCRACDGNTAIKAACPSCGKPARVRKQGPVFFTDCTHCRASILFFTNPGDSAATA